MIRLIHVADVHLGKTFQMLGEKGSDHRRQVEAALRATVALAIERQVDVVLVAGDLFDSRKPSRAARDVVGVELRRLADAGVRAAMIAGNHEATEQGRIPDEDDLRKAHPHLITFGPSPEAVVIPELDLTIVGQSATGQSVSPLADWPRGRTTRFAVGVAHSSVYRPGQIENDAYIHPREIRELGLDYLALGDWHSVGEVAGAPTPAWYAGAPEMLAFSDEKAGHALLVEIPEPGKASVTPIRVGRMSFKRLEIDAQRVDEPALRELLSAHAHPALVCDVILAGLLPVDQSLALETLQREFADRYFRLRLQNKTRPWLDGEALTKFGTETVLGRFVRLMRTRIAEASETDRPTLEEALQVGVAVLQSGEVPG